MTDAPHRCRWAGADPLMQAYNDREWGVPERDSRALWEKLVLDGFQAGLAWITVLRKRETMRAAFAGFAIDAVAAFTDSDVERLGRTRTAACFCPTTERDLADGIGPARALREAGARLCLGSDQHAVIDMFEEVRGLESHERLQSNQRGRFTPAELVDAASVTGYRSLGWHGGGRLAAGAPADFVIIDAASIRTAGSRPAQIHYAAAATDVTDVVVAGDHVVRARAHQLGDAGALMTKALADLEEA